MFNFTILKNLLLFDPFEPIALNHLLNLDLLGVFLNFVWPSTIEEPFWSLVDNYGVFFFFFCCVCLSIILIIISFFFSQKKKENEKLSSFECGFSSIGDSNEPFSIQFFIVGSLFLIFDLEILFLFPWAIHFRVLGWFGIFSFSIFLFLIIISFLYEWQEGALDWTKHSLKKKNNNDW